MPGNSSSASAVLGRKQNADMTRIAQHCRMCILKILEACCRIERCNCAGNETVAGECGIMGVKSVERVLIQSQRERKIMIWCVKKSTQSWTVEAVRASEGFGFGGRGPIPRLTVCLVDFCFFLSPSPLLPSPPRPSHLFQPRFSSGKLLFLAGHDLPPVGYSHLS